MRSLEKINAELQECIKELRAARVQEGQFRDTNPIALGEKRASMDRNKKMKTTRDRVKKAEEWCRKLRLERDEANRAEQQ